MGVCPYWLFKVKCVSQALHMLGHHLVILTSHRQLSEKVPADQPVFDLVFTDYFGLFALRDSKHYALYKVTIHTACPEAI